MNSKNIKHPDDPDEPIKRGNKSATSTNNSSSKKKRSATVSTKGNRKDSSKKKSKVVESPVELSSIGTKPVSELWIPGGGERSLEPPDSGVVKLFVSRVLFHKTKFITSPEWQLQYEEKDETAICKFVMDGVNLPLNMDRRKWWIKASKWVRQAIRQQRASKMNKLQYAFYGKYCVFTIFFLNFFSQNL